jgi:two-component system response regulator TtrR
VSHPAVFVVDDDRDFRESLISRLAALDYHVEGFASAEDFDAGFDTARAGCLILEIRMPGKNGIELYTELLKSGRRMPAIFLTAHADIPTAVAAMKLGAVEFLEKACLPVDFQIRVDRALNLDAEWRASETRFRNLDNAISQLSAADLETLEMVCQGETNKAMAAALFISERAVELRRQRLMQRLGVKTVAELLQLAVTHRVLSEVRGLHQGGNTL